jgi:putative SOS response-associated peptidase YedK
VSRPGLRPQDEGEPVCGRFAQQRPAAELAERFAAEPLVDDPGGHFNVAPTDDALVVVEHETRRAIVAYRWGLIPHWATSASFGSKTFNARAETVAVAPAFRDSFARRRCIVPVDAFYEWRRDGSVRQPFAIGAPAGGPLALAGLWASRRDPASGVRLRTFTIVTTRATPAMAELHDRMPVILPPASWDDWLGSTAEPGRLLGLLEPDPSIELTWHPVSQLVNNVRNDGPALLEPIAVPAMPDVGRS